MNIIETIDMLGDLKAQIAELMKEEKRLKDALINEGVDVAEGNFYRVAISDCERKSLDMDAVRAKLSPQFIRAHTSISHYMSVRVSARKTS